MKKVFLMMVMLFAMSVYSFAEDNNATEIERVERFEIKVNTKKLADYLELTTDQLDAVEAITDEFTSDMVFAGTESNRSSRMAVTKNAVGKNIKHMAYVLSREQYHKYLTVLNATLNNRGIDVTE